MTSILFGKFINIKSLTLIWPKITIIYFSKLHKIQSSQLSLITYIWYTITWYTWSVYPSCPSGRLVKSPHRFLRFTYQYLSCKSRSNGTSGPTFGQKWILEICYETLFFWKLHMSSTLSENFTCRAILIFL